jgi:hypothetical protein
MADYTPPAGNDVDFTFDGGYTAPDGDNVNFLFGTVADVVVSNVSRTNVYGSSVMPGFDSTVVTWASSIEGPYVIELGGSGQGTGDVLVSGTCTYNIDMETTITDSMLEGAASYDGSGNYQINIYVQSEDNLWNPQG